MIALSVIAGIVVLAVISGFIASSDWGNSDKNSENKATKKD